jgi:hypothetical protein
MNLIPFLLHPHLKGSLITRPSNPSSVQELSQAGDYKLNVPHPRITDIRGVSHQGTPTRLLAAGSVTTCQIKKRVKTIHVILPHDLPDRILTSGTPYVPD